MVQETGNNSFDYTKSEQYTLSIRLRTDGFSFSVYNPLNDTFSQIATEEVKESLSLAANLKQAYQHTEALQLPYRQTHIICQTTRSLHIPEEFFSPDYINPLFYHSYQKLENERILYNKLQRNRMIMLYGINQSCHSFFQEHYPKATYYAYNALLTEFFYGKSKLGNNNKLYVYSTLDTISLFCFEKGKMLLANTFNCTNNADKAYYILYTWKQLNLSQERDELHLLTEDLPLHSKEILSHELKKYIHQVFIMNLESNFDITATTTCE